MADSIIVRGVFVDLMSEPMARAQRAIEKFNRPLNVQQALLRTNFTNINAELKNMGGKTLPNYNKAIQEVSVANSGFFDVMRMSLPTWKQHFQGGMRFSNMGGRVASRTRQLTHGMRGFRMEMLSVMFGGQMVSQAMFGLLQPAMKVSGVFEIFSVILQTFFLPIAMEVLEFLLPLMDWFIGAPEWIKIAIGAIVLFVGILGVLLGVVGAVVLFIGGIVLAVGGAWAAVIAIAIVAIAAIITFFVVFADEVWAIWKKVGRLIFKAWMWVVDNVFKPVWGWINEHIVQPIKELLGPVWEWVKEKTRPVWEWIRDNVWKPVAGFFKKWVIDPIKEKWDWLMSKLQEGWNWIKDKLAPVFSIFGGDEVEGPKQSGGYIPHTGLYKLHAGETVQQAGSTFNNNIVVNASSNVDIEMLKTQLSSQWADDLARLSRR